MHHYFGTKHRLFAAAIHIPIDPMEALIPLRETPVEELGLTLPSMLLPLWDSNLRPVLLATMRSMFSGADVGLVQTFFRQVIVAEIAARVDDPAGSGILRAEFVASQLVGVAMARYILELEPFASLPVQRIALTIAPNLQRYLTGELPAWPAP